MEKKTKSLIETAHQTLENSYLSDTDSTLSETYTYSKFATELKVKRLKDGIKSIPSGMVPYIIQIIAAHANNEQIAEIIEAFKKPTQ